jgi:hypothetical protein
MTRLPYETKGGAFSEGDAAHQLFENLRLVAEGYYIIGHNRKEKGDTESGEQMLRIGKKVEETLELTRKLLTAGRLQ